jgi:hypothetical protein
MAIPLTDGIEEISEDSWSLKQGRAKGQPGVQLKE